MSFRIGNVLFYKSPTGWRRTRQHVPGTGGQALMAPPNMIPLPYRLYLMGGLLSNLLFMVIGVAAFLLWRPVAVGWGLVSVVLLLMNGIPLGFNDAQSLRIVRQDPGNQQLLWIQLTVNARLTAGASYADLPAAVYTPVKTAERTYFNDFQLLLIATRALAAQDYAGAATILRKPYDDGTEMMTLYFQELVQLLLLALLFSAPTDPLIPELWESFQQQPLAKRQQIFLVRAAHAWYTDHDAAAAQTALTAGHQLPREPLPADQALIDQMAQRLSQDMQAEKTTQ
ncbi:hypothetical protein [Schleiferilactobacillus shenzhenensis]|uniref:Uncharacterized protein n=1 Tax=Schleiferilactobacillus shenzhenensis LY-73 TaxID=1231336 RepID=U4TPW2_9LACO|nr:hypothetical protein [Schleiferilactobacillus shenzhenensis]ERL63923.1 hypothetical protein L248_1742 [Schleiferilactobacillus shenzhenensis LY-73]